MVSCWTMRPRATGPDRASLARIRPQLPRRAWGGPGALGASSALPGPSPDTHKGSPSWPSQASAPFWGRPLPSREPVGGPGGNKGAAARGQRGRGAGAGAHQSAALSSRITSSYAASSSRRWPLKLTPAILRAGPRPNRETHGWTDRGGGRE